MNPFVLQDENGQVIGQSHAKIDLSLTVEASHSVNFVNWQAERAAKIKAGSPRQNNFSFLKKILVKNNGTEDVNDASLTITFLPDCIKCQEVYVSCLEKQKTTTVDSFSIEIDPKYLYELSEAIAGSMSVVLKAKDGTVLATQMVPLDILPIEESASEDRIDEILVSFVTPNDDLVRELADKAAKRLEEKYQRSSFAGYQFEDPDKIVEELDAIFLAIKDEGIHYSNPPASFEKTFQRIRLPHTVLSEKTATCIDFAILFASVMENVGLNPLIIAINGHAFNGCWLNEESFPSGLEDNSTKVLNYASAGCDKIFLFNSVDAAAGNLTNFAQSKENGYHTLQEADPFLYALDIARCRKEGLRPIPTPHNVNGQSQISYDVSGNEDYTNERISDHEQGVIEAQPGNTKSKFDLWEEKLLDLNLRNNLINLHLGGGNCQILCADAGSLFAKIQETNTFTLLPQNSEPVHDPRFLAFEQHKTDSADLVEALRLNRFYVASANGMPDRNLIALSRKANTEIEESGCNPLFLTIGAIRWFDNDKAAEVGKMSLTSPILLIPASLPRRRTGPYYQLELDLDGVQFNTTAFEYFKQNLGLDFSEFDNLFSTKDTVIDLQKIYNTIRNKIYSKKGWAVLDNFVCLSMFSFAHFVMWSDLKNYRQEFLKNPIVSSLVHGQKEWEDPKDGILPNQLDSKVKPQDLAIPLPADSSQIEAIAASTAGESFVLDGPPGTGKSQTIANMIVNFMFHQKSILFVAEKEVALDVVKKRLDALKLGRFCLQISSAKANKKDVLAQIQQALEFGQAQNPGDYQKEADALKAKRDQLNQTLNSLHQSRAFFVSIYQAIVSYLQVEKFAQRTRVDEAYARKLTLDQYQTALKQLSLLETYGENIGSYAKNPFIPFQNRHYDIVERDALLEKLGSFVPLVSSYADTITALWSNVFGNLTTSQANLDLLERAFQAVRNDPNINYSYLSNEEFSAKQHALLAYLELAKRCVEQKNEVLASFKPEILNLDPTALNQDYQMATTAHLFKRWKLIAHIQGTLKPYALTKKVLRTKALKDDLAALTDIIAKRKELSGSDSFIRFIYPDEESKNLEAIAKDIAQVHNTVSLHEILTQLQSKDASLQKTWDYFKNLGKDSAPLFDAPLSSFLQKKAELAAANLALKQAYGFDFYADEDDDNYVASHLVSLKKAIGHSGALGEWATFLNCLDETGKYVPASVLNDYRKGQISEGELTPCYQAALFYEIIALGLAEERLTNLSAITTDQEIAFYKEEIQKFNILTIQETAARVTANYPSSNTAYASSTQIYQLNHLCANGGRGKSLRGIFEEFGSLIHSICPCFLMSPLAVSQYLEPGKHQFDAVVFDEASQIQTSEAIGPVARGKSVIVAGDQQQMPPTNFFAATIGGGDDEEDNDDLAYDDLESFLDDCIALHLPRIRLNCHYRSNHESLIAFSNNRFYDNSLLTFPSPTNQVSKVSFRYIGGRYEKGKGINRDEADAIVQEVLRRLKDPVLSTKSIGIITFNEKQQDLVQDLLDKQVYSHPEYNTQPGGESIFVKNLENVQGDERDVTLFSICFGPDPKTRTMVLNFGPLSRERGERRLNVAVSRAREEMIVYASTQPEDIRAEQAKNEGAEFLRSFLRYAKNGVATLTNSSTGTVYSAQTGIADFLAEDLRKKGLKVDLNIGSSSFRIDLGIKDPDNPGVYALGVICDSHSYAEAATCRDRNVVEPEMLNRLHWKLVHVWSVEYFDHKDIVVQRILEALKEATKPASPAPTPTGSAPVNIAIVFEKKEATEAEKYPNKRPYVYYQPTRIVGQDVAALIVRAEWPISRTMVEKRYREVTNIGRVGNRISDTITCALASFARQCYDDEIYYWPSVEALHSYSIYRTGSDRSMTDLPYQELGAAAYDIIMLQGSMSFDDLLKQISLLFGLSALKEKTRNHLRVSLGYVMAEPTSKLQQDQAGIISIKS
jgi:superfamily I DNA and/or RNA helicase